MEVNMHHLHHLLGPERRLQVWKERQKTAASSLSAALLHGSSILMHLYVKEMWEYKHKSMAGLWDRMHQVRLKKEEMMSNMQHKGGGEGKKRESEPADSESSTDPLIHSSHSAGSSCSCWSWFPLFIYLVSVTAGQIFKNPSSYDPTGSPNVETMQNAKKICTFLKLKPANVTLNVSIRCFSSSFCAVTRKIFNVSWWKNKREAPNAPRCRIQSLQEEMLFSESTGFV